MDDLIKLENKIKKVYKQASKEAQDKVNEFYAKFKTMDEIKQKKVKSGEMDESTYLTWRKNKMLMGEKYQDLVNVLTTDMTHANQIAASITNGYTPEAYANGMNHGTYEVEYGSQINTNFTLYNRQAVERLIRDDPDIIPWKAKIDIPKDKRWNKQHINNAITQGILQGESIPKVSKRLQKVTEMNNVQAVRTARTAMTAANNAGHMDAFKRAQGMGIKLKKQWLASLDNRTRDSHIALDGESVPLDEKFSNGLMYPGDPDGKPSEVYNCRCRQIADVEGVDQGKIDDLSLRNNYKLGSMSYDEWKSRHTEEPNVDEFETSLVQDTLYHGTNVDNIEKFTTSGKESGGAIFFANDSDYAEEEANVKYESRGGIKTMYEVKLNIHNPLVIEMSETEFADPVAEKKFLKRAKEENFDAVIFKGTGDFSDQIFYAVFSPDQVKIKNKRKI